MEEYYAASCACNDPTAILPTLRRLYNEVAKQVRKGRIDKIVLGDKAYKALGCTLLPATVAGVDEIDKIYFRKIPVYQGNPIRHAPWQIFVQGIAADSLNEST